MNFKKIVKLFFVFLFILLATSLNGCKKKEEAPAPASPPVGEPPQRQLEEPKSEIIPPAAPAVPVSPKERR